MVSMIERIYFALECNSVIKFRDFCVWSSGNSQYFLIDNDVTDIEEC